MQSIEEVRAKIHEKAQHSLARGSMFGRDCEIYMREFLSLLAFIDQREQEWKDHAASLKSSGAFVATGVKGGFIESTGTWGTDQEIGSVYAIIASKMGYLEAENFYSTDELAAIKNRLINNIDRIDCTTDSFFKEYGTPSWPDANLGSYYPRTYLYLSKDPKVDFIACDFYNQAEYAPNGGKASGIHGNLPRLRNIRTPHPKFKSQFAFTRFGIQIVEELKARKLEN